MRAAETPPQGRVASIMPWLLGLVIVTVAVTGSTLDPTSGDMPMKPGGVVSYSEDRLGRPWTILRRAGYQTWEIRNGGVDAIVERQALSPYRGYPTDITVGMAGLHWRDKVAEIQRAEGVEQVARHHRLE